MANDAKFDNQLEPVLVSHFPTYSTTQNQVNMEHSFLMQRVKLVCTFTSYM